MSHDLPERLSILADCLECEGPEYKSDAQVATELRGIALGLKSARALARWEDARQGVEDEESELERARRVVG